MRPIRIRDIQKAYGIGFNTIVEFLREKKIRLKDASLDSVITDEQLQLIDRKFRTLRKFDLLKEDLPVRSKIVKKLDEDQKNYDNQYGQIVSQQSDFEHNVLKKDLRDSEILQVFESRYLSILKRRFNLEMQIRQFTSFVKRHPSYGLNSVLQTVSWLSRIYEKSTYDERFQIRFQKEAKKYYNKYHRVLSPAIEDTHYSLPQVAEVLDLSWEDIHFRDGLLEFLHQGKVYSITAPGSKDALNTIKLSFTMRIPFLKVKINGDSASVNDLEFLQNVILLLGVKCSCFHITDSKLIDIDYNRFNKIPKDLVQIFFPIDRTRYFEYLQHQQADTVNIVPVFEHNKENPDGFLFSIRNSSGWFVVWESCSEDIHKATYVFDINEDELNTFLQLLFDYIISETPRKRESLRRRDVQEFLGINYRIIDHDHFDPWKKKMESLAGSPRRIRQGVVSKNESEVSYVSSAKEHTYKPVHNIMQNALKEWLERSMDYKTVVLEENNIDIKATTNRGEVHLFEVKTASPKMCIREALGQILEYAHFKENNHYQKLIIVGPQAPEKDIKDYVDLLRELYGIPVWYRQFDIINSDLVKGV